MTKKAYSYIRFSRPEQIKGNSLARQKEMSETYCEENNLELDTSLSLYDLGVSAFKGKNAEQGALGAFLKAIDKGKVESGSYLLVESLDRLSRQKVVTALTLFLNILEKGITIVTLSDGLIYAHKNINPYELIISITIMTRAHEESAQKSKRLLAANKSKRKNISHTKLTGMCPAWLKLNKDKTEFHIIPDKVKTIKLIFELSASGMGTYSIISELKERNINPIGKSGKWYQSYLTKILKGREVLGELQSKSSDGEQVFENYYPQIISKDLYYKVQKGIISRTKSSGGRKGKHYTNLFSKLAFCGYSVKPEEGFKCTGSNEVMICTNKGKYSYLQCYAAKNSNNHCQNTNRLWRYDDFEKALLTSLTEIDASVLFGNTGSESRARELETSIDSLTGDIEDTHRKINLIIDSGLSRKSSDSGFSKSLSNKLLELESSASRMEDTLQENKILLRAEKTKAKEPTSNTTKLRTLLKTLSSTKGENLYILRLKIAELLKEAIERIDVYPCGIKISPLAMDKTPPKTHKPYYLAIVKLKSGNIKYIQSTPIPSTPTGKGFNFHMFNCEEDMIRRGLKN